MLGSLWLWVQQNPAAALGVALYLVSNIAVALTKIPQTAGFAAGLLHVCDMISVLPHKDGRGVLGALNLPGFMSQTADEKPPAPKGYAAVPLLAGLVAVCALLYGLAHAAPWALLGAAGVAVAILVVSGKRGAKTLAIAVLASSLAGCGWWRLHSQAFAEDLAACLGVFTASEAQVVSDRVNMALTSGQLSDVASHDALHALEQDMKVRGVKAAAWCVSQLVADAVKTHPREAPAAPPAETPDAGAAVVASAGDDAPHAPIGFKVGGASAAKSVLEDPETQRLLRRAQEWLDEHPAKAAQ